MGRRGLVLVLAAVVVVVSDVLAWWLAQPPQPQKVGFPAIDAVAVLRHTQTLSSDEFAGRAPATSGEEHTVTYLADQFRAMGLKPGAPDGTYFQKVPLVGITPDPNVTLTLRKRTTSRALKFKDDVVMWTRRMAETVSLDASEMVFVGYHKPTATVKPDWDLSGGVEDLQLFWMVGYRVAQADTPPRWKPGAEFGRMR